MAGTAVDRLRAARARLEAQHLPLSRRSSQSVDEIDALQCERHTGGGAGTDAGTRDEASEQPHTASWCSSLNSLPPIFDGGRCVASRPGGRTPVDTQVDHVLTTSSEHSDAVDLDRTRRASPHPSASRNVAPLIATPVETSQAASLEPSFQVNRHHASKQRNSSPRESLVSDGVSTSLKGQRLHEDALVPRHPNTEFSLRAGFWDSHAVRQAECKAVNSSSDGEEVSCYVPECRLSPNNDPAPSSARVGSSACSPSREGAAVQTLQRAQRAAQLGQTVQSSCHLAFIASPQRPSKVGSSSMLRPDVATSQCTFENTLADVHTGTKSKKPTSKQNPGGATLPSADEGRAQACRCVDALERERARSRVARWRQKQAIWQQKLEELQREMRGQRDDAAVEVMTAMPPSVVEFVESSTPKATNHVSMAHRHDSIVPEKDSDSGRTGEGPAYVISKDVSPEPSQMGLEDMSPNYAANARACIRTATSELSSTNNGSSRVTTATAREDALVPRPSPVKATSYPMGIPISAGLNGTSTGSLAEQDLLLDATLNTSGTLTIETFAVLDVEELTTPPSKAISQVGIMGATAPVGEVPGVAGRSKDKREEALRLATEVRMKSTSIDQCSTSTSCTERQKLGSPLTDEQWTSQTASGPTTPSTPEPSEVLLRTRAWQRESPSELSRRLDTDYSSSTAPASVPGSIEASLKVYRSLKSASQAARGGEGQTRSAIVGEAVADTDVNEIEAAAEAACLLPGREDTAAKALVAGHRPDGSTALEDVIEAALSSPSDSLPRYGSWEFSDAASDSSSADSLPPLRLKTSAGAYLRAIGVPPSAWTTLPFSTPRIGYTSSLRSRKMNRRPTATGTVSAMPGPAGVIRGVGGIAANVAPISAGSRFGSGRRKTAPSAEHNLVGEPGRSDYVRTARRGKSPSTNTTVGSPHGGDFCVDRSEPPWWPSRTEVARWRDGPDQLKVGRDAKSQSEGSYTATSNTSTRRAGLGSEGTSSLVLESSGPEAEIVRPSTASTTAEVERALTQMQRQVYVTPPHWRSNQDEAYGIQMCGRPARRDGDGAPALMALAGARDSGFRARSSSFPRSARYSTPMPHAAYATPGRQRDAVVRVRNTPVNQHQVDAALASSNATSSFAYFNRPRWNISTHTSSSREVATPTAATPTPVAQIWLNAKVADERKGIAFENSVPADTPENQAQPCRLDHATRSSSEASRRAPHTKLLDTQASDDEENVDSLIESLEAEIESLTYATARATVTADDIDDAPAKCVDSSPFVESTDSDTLASHISKQVVLDASEAFDWLEEYDG